MLTITTASGRTQSVSGEIDRRAIRDALRDGSGQQSPALQVILIDDMGMVWEEAFRRALQEPFDVFADQVRFQIEVIAHLFQSKG